MVIESPLEVGQPRRIVFCKYNELIDNGDGTYKFIDLSGNALGFGSMVIVIDKSLILFYDDEEDLLYAFTLPTNGSGSGGDNTAVVGTAIVGTSTAG